MALTNLQKSVIEKARASGAGAMGVSLTDEACSFLIATIANDLGVIHQIPELSASTSDFFSVAPLDAALSVNVRLYDLFERLIAVAPDSDTYFSCLAALHRSRLKYARILQHQPMPTMDQVGPRSLLQFGTMRPHTLATFLLWRKWIFDIDNRAGQETGYYLSRSSLMQLEEFLSAQGGVRFGGKATMARAGKLIAFANATPMNSRFA